MSTTDIDTLAELNAIITDATLIDTNDSRLSDARTPTAHTHTASEITDFDTEVSNNASVTANTAKVSADGSIATHSDVIITGITDGQILKWVAANSRFEPANDDTGGGGGATNLAYTASPTNGIVTSDTGTDATIPLADGTNAGLLAPADFTKLSGIEANATADQTGAEIEALLDAQTGGTAWRTEHGDVRLTDAQTLTNKTITFGSNTLTDVMSLTTAQTVGAGIKKTFQANASTAGFALGGVTADPSSLVNGDI